MSNLDEQIEAAKRNVEAARKQHATWLRDRDAAAKKAFDEVYSQFSESVGAASKIQHEAQEMLDALLIQKAQAEADLTSTYVRWVNKCRDSRFTYVDNWQPDCQGRKEIWSSDSLRPDNMSMWSNPKVGEIIMRHLKKDGSPSKKFTLSWNGGFTEKWLPEGEKP